ncbi:calcium-binding protein [Methylomicrobium lacus]|uniref:calcium-binding protein n=1 Tax=Methylomicrobium lacus TaxID=136992 RepID=UPI0004B432BB|nr:calcium-binding protein [Methylomicrobium lacus]
MSIINGTSKNDVLKSLAENDDLTGGEAGFATGIFNGVDTALFSGKYADSATGVANYSLTAAYDASFGYYLGVTDINSSDGVTDGSDRVRADIEIVRFTDSTSADPEPKFLSLTQEMVANGLTDGNQTNTTVLSLANGGFLNFWASEDGFYFRKFNTDTTSDNFEIKLLDTTNDSLSTDVTVANFSDGGFIVAWSSPDADGTGVYAQRFDADGAAVSPKFRVNDTITADQGKPAIAVLSDGGFVIAWVSENQGDSIHDGQSFGDDPNQPGVFAQWYDGSTVPNPIGWEVKVSDSGASDPFVSAIDNNRVIIGYEGISTGTEKMTIQAKIFDDYGNVESYLYDFQPHPDVADGSDPNDGYDAFDDQVVSAYTGYSESPFNINYAIEPKGKVFDDSGIAIENELRQEAKNPVAATLAFNNKTVVVWQAPVDPYVIIPPTGQARVDYDRSIILRLYDNITGEAITHEIKANTFTRYDQKEPAVAALKDGGFVVVWQSMLQDGSYRGIYGQRFDNDGNKVGEEFQANTKVADSQKEPTVTGLDDGGFVVSWVAEYQDGNQQGKYQNGLSGTEIIMQRFDKDGNKMGLSIAGGVGDDSLSIGGLQPIQLDGAAGNDLLTSGDGIDTLRGGDGNDVLDAGKGNDFMVGGAGDDRIIAGEGDDFVNGGAGSDTLVLLGSKLDYEVKKIGSGFTVRSLNSSYADGTDTLQGVEYLAFKIKTDDTDDGITSLNSFGSGGTGGTGGSGGSGGNSNVPGIELSDFDVKQVKVLSGTDNSDTLTGGNTKGAADTLQAGNGNDLYVALGNALVIYDTGGNDTLQVSTSHVDLSQPYSNANKIKGLNNIENVELTGKKALKLTGNDQDNILIGNDGANKIIGGAGSDIIAGGLGKDKLTGGEGSDIFLFKDSLSKKNVDVITDFDSGTDKIRLSSVIFKDLDADNDGIINFESGYGLKSAHTDTASFIVYDTKSGKLYYDEAGKDAIQFAKLATDNGGSTPPPSTSGGGFGTSSGSGQSSSGSGSSSSPEVTTVGVKFAPDLVVTDFDLFI